MKLCKFFGGMAKPFAVHVVVVFAKSRRDLERHAILAAKKKRGVYERQHPHSRNFEIMNHPSLSEVRVIDDLPQGPNWSAGDAALADKREYVIC
jgi:hypothetical protein